MNDKEKHSEIIETFTNLIYSTLQKEGYSKRTINRLFFEEALDWQACLVMPKFLYHCLKMHKIPKYFKISISGSEDWEE